jgi:hypothetical protein
MASARRWKLAVQKLDAESEALRVGVQGENNVQLDESLNSSSQQSVWQIIASNQNLSSLKAYMEDHIYHIILSTKSSLSYTVWPIHLQPDLLLMYFIYLTIVVTTGIRRDQYHVDKCFR